MRKFLITTTIAAVGLLTGCVGEISYEDCWNDAGLWNITYTTIDTNCPAGNWKSNCGDKWNRKIWIDEQPCGFFSKEEWEKIDGCDVHTSMYGYVAYNDLSGEAKVEVYCISTTEEVAGGGIVDQTVFQKNTRMDVDRTTTSSNPLRPDCSVTLDIEGTKTNALWIKAWIKP